MPLGMDERESMKVAENKGFEKIGPQLDGET
jgi:hypothetical protein